MSAGLRVYLACTVRGDRSRLACVRHIRAALEAHGHSVLTAHLLDDDVEEAEGALSDREIYVRDLAWLERADVLVAEVSGSSFGVGFEVGYTIARAAASGQRALVLYDRARAAAISRLATGITHPAVVVAGYDDEAEIDRLVADACARWQATGSAGGAPLDAAARHAHPHEHA